MAGFLTVGFHVHVNKKFGLLKPQVADLEVDRAAPARVKDLRDHLAAELGPLLSHHMLFKAVCLKMHNQVERCRRRHRSHSGSNESDWNLVGTIPLVCDEIWSSILAGYSPDHLEVHVHHLQDLGQARRAPLMTSCMPKFFLDRELKHLDIARFLPAKDLKGGCIRELCQEIFEHGTKVSHDLRRGVWLHLLPVFHPGLTSREEREQYMRKLRMVYDHLKGKLEGQGVDNYEQQQLVDAVYRDAIRTDPDNPFFANCRPTESSIISQHFHQTDNGDEDNIQKLINIIVIYTLEHEQVSYTQGMTDILSPILYVMKHEADAYIVFAAMVERIKKNFEEWCSGTLHKLQRFRHLCEVLDPELYHSLTGNMEEDAFVLFFGMVLIECRREFSFEDSFHLLETIWAGEACIKNTFPSTSDLSCSQWTRYMTYESPEVLQQVFEGSGGPYCIETLPNASLSYSVGHSYQYSTNPSLLSDSSTQPVHAFLRRASEAEPTPTHVIAEVHSTSSPLSPSLVSSLSGEHSSSVSPLSVHDSDAVSPLSVHDSDASIGLLSPSPSQPKPMLSRTEDDQLTLTYHEQTDSRLRSQSDSNLHGFLSQNDTRYSRSPLVKRSTSPVTLDGFVAGAIFCNHKLENSSFSHSESELYDSFSNSKVVVVNQQQSRLLGRNPTEMSDMSSISSGTASANGNLISSLVKSMEQEQASDASESGGPERAGNSEHTLTSNGSRISVSALSPDSGVVGKITSTSEGGSLMTSPEVTNAPAVDVSNKTPKKKVSIRGSPNEGSVASTPVLVPDVTIKLLGAEATDVPLNFSDNVDPVLDIRKLGHKPEEIGGGACGGGVVEHGGMITSVSHSIKNSLVPHHRPIDTAALKEENVSSQSDVPHQRRRRIPSSPKRIHGKVTPTDHSINPTPIHYDSEIPSSARVTPVAFFDTMDKLSKSAPSNRGPVFPSQLSLRKSHLRGGGGGRSESERDMERSEIQVHVEAALEEDREAEPTYRRANRQRTCSELEVSVMSQLMSTEDGAPRVTKEESLSIPFYECYSLFVCLSILIQNRNEIMQDGADFYRLSEILNAQAGIQDLDETLRVAHELYRTYRKYQVACFKGSNKRVDCWLDDTH